MKSTFADQIEPIITEVKRHPSLIIVSHENPDGDSLGAQFGLALGLLSMGKDIRIICKNPVPKIYDFLPGQNLSTITNEALVDHGNVLIVLDCGDLKRTGIALPSQPPPVIINIDHHVSNTQFGLLNWVDISACATSEMIFHLLSLLDVKLTPQIATNLYTGILTDTGSFQYSNTTAYCLNIASQLVMAGADPNGISLSVYDRKTVPALRLMGIVLNEMEIHHKQSLALLTVTKSMLENLYATYEDTEELVELTQKIGSIKASVLIKEIKEGEYKISFRSKGNVDVSQMASLLDGGGHPNAAGAKVKGELPQIKEKILKMTAEFLF